MHRSFIEVHQARPIPKNHKDEKDGIKLFSKSSTSFKEQKVSALSHKQVRPDLLAHRKVIKGDIDEAAKSVAVSPEWVLNQEGVYYKGPDDSRSKLVTEI